MPKPTKNKQYHPVRVGQIWQDDEYRIRRGEFRYLEVIAMTEGYAHCMAYNTKRPTHIRLDRMKPGPKGFTLVCFP